MYVILKHNLANVYDLKTYDLPNIYNFKTQSVRYVRFTKNNLINMYYVLIFFAFPWWKDSLIFLQKEALRSESVKTIIKAAEELYHWKTV